MTTKFNMTRDINGFNGFGLVPADDQQDTTLVSGTAQTFTVPSNANYKEYIAVFSIDPGLRVFVRYDGTAATLPGSSVAASHSELNPVGRRLAAGSTFSCITADDSTYITVSYYALQ